MGKLWNQAAWRSPYLLWAGWSWAGGGTKVLLSSTPEGQRRIKELKQSRAAAGGGVLA